MTMEKITISEVKGIRELIGASHLILFAVAPDGTRHVATHGLTEKNAREAASAGNKLKNALGWPEDLCNDKPLNRCCKNCTYYQPDYGMYCFNGWSGDGSRGNCQLEPTKTKVEADQKCRYFEPR